MNPLPRIDAHQHFWRLSERQGQWPPAALEAIHRDFLPADYEPLRQRAGIDGTVVVQSLPQEADTRWLLSLAEQHAWIWGVVGWADLKAPDAAQRIQQLAHPKLKGLRPMLQDIADDGWIADTAVDPAARAMVAQDLVFDALVLPRHLKPLRDFALRHPDLTLIIDHGAKPLIAGQVMQPWADDMAALAALPQVHCKVSGLLTEAGAHATEAGLRPYVATLWELFGPGRLVWGSDWPVLRLAGEYAGWQSMSESLLASVAPSLTDSQRDAIFGGNAQRLYRLAPPPLPLSARRAAAAGAGLQAAS